MRHEVPVTARGSGTGNYGQAVPLHGGVVLDLQRMDQIEQISADGVAVMPARRAARGARGRGAQVWMGASLLSIDRGQGVGWQAFLEEALAASVRLLMAVCAISTLCARSRLSPWKPSLAC